MMRSGLSFGTQGLDGRGDGDGEFDDFLRGVFEIFEGERHVPIAVPGRGIDTVIWLGSERRVWKARDGILNEEDSANFGNRVPC